MPRPSPWGIVAVLALVAIVSLVRGGWRGAWWPEDAQARRLQHEGERADGIVVVVDAQPWVGATSPTARWWCASTSTARAWRSRSTSAGRSPTSSATRPYRRVRRRRTQPSRAAGRRHPGSRPPGGAGPDRRGRCSAGWPLVAFRHALLIHRADPARPVAAGAVAPRAAGRSRWASGRGRGPSSCCPSRSGELSVEPIGLGRVNPTFEPEAWVAGARSADDGAGRARRRQRDRRAPSRLRRPSR